MRTTKYADTAERLAAITDPEVRAWILDEIDAMAWMALTRRDMELLAMVNLTWELADGKPAGREEA